jgi:hypothetical protein
VNTVPPLRRCPARHRLDGATNVAQNTWITVGFSEAITGYGGGNVALTRVSDGVAVPFTQSYRSATRELVLNPYGTTADVLAPGVQYRVTLTGGATAIRGLTGVPLANTTITFTTQGAVPPTVSSSTPADGATNVARNTWVTVGFSEAITGYGGGNVALTRVSDGVAVPFTQSYRSATRELVLNPYGTTADVFAPGVQYRVTLTGGATAIRGLTGVPLANTTITFTTGP